MGLGGITFVHLGVLALLPLALVLIPVILVLASRRVNGSEKLGWALVVLCTSLLGYGVFLIVTHKK